MSGKSFRGGVWFYGSPWSLRERTVGCRLDLLSATLSSGNRISSTGSRIHQHFQFWKESGRVLNVITNGPTGSPIDY